MPILVTCECGKQFQAKDENVGRRFNCPNCDREVVVPKPVAESYYDAPLHSVVPVKTSGNAIASLVLGILSIITCTFGFLFGIPAIICGAMGLNTIGKSEGRVGGKGFAITGLVMGCLSLLMIPVMIALLLPAVQAAREAARRSQCVNNMKQIGLAMHNYLSTYDRFPPAASVDANGKPLLSWRVAILPYIEEQGLYSQFKLDEPWDSPNNIKLLSQMPKTYICPSEPPTGTTTTHYEAIAGPGTIFEGPEGVPINAITDGTSNTILVVEATNPVEWSKPDDVDVNEITTALGSKHPGGANALFADGSVHFLKIPKMGAAILKSLSTRAGGEVISSDSY
jgi:prepilin-type processing-associated H-X9-DG protein